MILLNAADLSILIVLKLRVFLEVYGFFGGVILMWKSYSIISNSSISKFQRIIFLKLGSQLFIGKNPSISTLIRTIQELIRRNRRVDITHVYREANFAVDYLATLACSLPLELHVLNSTPKGVLQLMSQVNYGVVYPRFVFP